jgi:hypothetical protein
VGRRKGGHHGQGVEAQSKGCGCYFCVKVQHSSGHSRTLNIQGNISGCPQPFYLPKTLTGTDVLKLFKRYYLSTGQARSHGHPMVPAQPRQ